MFDGVSEEDDPDAALRALLARQLDCVASMMVGGDDGPRRAAVMLCRCLSLPTTRCATGRPTSPLSGFASTCRGAACSAAGVHTPILVVAASAAGNQMKAIEEVFAAFG